MRSQSGAAISTNDGLNKIERVCQAVGIRPGYPNHHERIERIRLYPTARQKDALRFMLDVTRQLYNALLQERRDAYRFNKVRL
ncbi:MAG TPA: helix-turn-helix domain-containing protein, partial [Candidatus Cybelea sp.]|nr:helix-turn-helix domain-containing protein [Candidatus Cybelea sp.]